MGSIFNFDQNEILTFFAVLVRFSVLIAVLPFVGDRMIPVPIKVLLSLSITLALFPALLKGGEVIPTAAATWGSTAGGILAAVASEALFALILGFTARLAFETITFGGNLVGSAMGFASASSFDPHQESQTQVVAQVQMTVAMLIFLAVDGHHLMLRASFESYRIVGIGGTLSSTIWDTTAMGAAFAHRLAQFSGDVLNYGIQLAAPVAVSVFAANVAFGVLARAMPQINLLVMSFAVSGILGFLVLYLSMDEYSGAVVELFAKSGVWMESMSLTIAGRQ